MAPRAAIVVMAKRPVPGEVKTRLGPALGPGEAAALYGAMLADRCEQVSRVPGVAPAIAIQGWDPRPHDGRTAARHADGLGHALRAGRAEPIAGIVPPGFEVVPQPEGGLGEGLGAAADFFLARGVPVLLVDSDSPTLPQALLEQAVDRLCGRDGCDVVLGPSEDGGYWAIGLRERQPALFEDMPWSTSRVLAITLERAAAAGLEACSLPAWWDVDTPDSLERLERDLLDRTWPTRTAQWMRERRSLRWRARACAEPLPSAERWSSPWKRTSSRPVHATPWLSIREDQVQLPDGKPTVYTVVDCGSCVGVLPLVDEDTVLMVRQYRYVADRVTWEMPTGGVHRGEDVRAAAVRELAEEAGVAAGRLEPLGAYHTSKSVMDETAHLFVARELSPVEARGDETEFIHAEALPFEQVLAMVRSGEIVDSMTIIAVLREALERGRR